MPVIVQRPLVSTLVGLMVVATLSLAVRAAQQPAPAPRAPAFQVDPAWPSIPNNWVLGEVSSIAVGPSDHIWVLHRPASIPADRRANAAPASVSTR